MDKFGEDGVAYTGLSNYNELPDNPGAEVYTHFRQPVKAEFALKDQLPEEVLKRGGSVLVEKVPRSDMSMALGSEPMGAAKPWRPKGRR